VGNLKSTRRAFLKHCATAAAVGFGGASSFLCTTRRGGSAEVSSTPSRNARGEWPLLRADSTVSGHQPLPLGIRNPSAICNLQLSSAPVPWVVAHDLNNDGQEELLIPAADGLGAWTIDGNRLWMYPFLTAFTYIDTVDIDDDGLVEVIINATGRNRVIVLDGASGTLRYSIVLPDEVTIFYYNIYIGRYLENAIGLQMAIATNGPLFGTDVGAQINTHLYTFAPATGATQVWSQTVDESTINNIRFITLAASIVGDVDNDGDPELVTFVNDGMVIQDIRTGTIKPAKAGSIVGQGRNYGTFAIADLDGDGANELMLMSDLLSLHFEAFRFSNQNSERLWGKLYDGPWPIGTTFIHIAGASPLADVNGDGRKELVMSEWVKGMGWVLRVWDATTGTLVASEPGLYVLWMGDLNGDGVAEVIATQEHGLLPEEFTSTRIYSFRDNTPTLEWQTDHARLEARVGYPLDEPLRYPATVKGRSQDARQAFAFDSDGDGYPEVVLRLRHQGDGIGEEWALVGYNGREYVVKRVVTTNRGIAERIVSVTSNVMTGESMLVVSSAGGRIDTITVSGRIVGTVKVGQFYDYRYLIADVDGDGRNEILVEDGEGVKLIGTSRSAAFGVRWTTPGKLLACVDLDERNAKAIIISKSASQGHVAVSAVTGDRRTLWETLIPELSTSHLIDRPVHSITVGRFSGRGGDDLYISGGLTVPTGNGNSDRSWMLRGDTGQIVWYNDASDPRLPLPSLGPTKLSDGVPIDMNGDGSDDIAMVSQVWFLALDGPTGQLCFKPVALMHALQNGTGVSYQWSGYATLTAGEEKGEKYLLAHHSSGAWGPLKLHPLGDLPVHGLWREIPTQGRNYVALCDVDDIDGPDVVGAARSGSVQIFDPLTGKIRYDVKQVSDAAFVATVAKTGTDKGQIVAAGGKNVYLLDLTTGTPDLVFTYTAEAALSMPIIGDVDGDGASEIVAATITGRLLVIAQKRRRRMASHSE
jgi:hypothetical protein